jgi:hypothetical protein
VSVPGYTTYSVLGMPQNLAVISASAALAQFRSYMNSITLPFTYDLVQAFVQFGFFLLCASIVSIGFKFFKLSKDIWGDTGATTDQRSAVAGLAYLSQVCRGYSIVEEHGGFRSVQVSLENNRSICASFHTAV